jgi:hypothetical protein
MAISLKHQFNSGKLDGSDATLVQPSNWNSEHLLSIGSPKLFGRTSSIGATTSSLTAVTQANPGVFTTSAAHNLIVGQLVTITGVVGMTQLNSNTYVVNTTPLTTTFTLSSEGTTGLVALNTSAFTAYSSGGTVTPTGTGLAEEIAVTGTGSAVLATTPSVTNPTVTNYVETLYTANTSTAITIDLANGTVQNLTLTGNATITMPTAVAGKSFIIILSQDGTGSRTVTWSTVSWPSATAPTITSTASKRDIFSFFSNGSSWFGTTIGQNYT